MNSRHSMFDGTSIALEHLGRSLQAEARGVFDQHVAAKHGGSGIAFAFFSTAQNLFSVRPGE